MLYRVERAAEVLGDLKLIFDHLTAAYVTFGEPLSEAKRHAVDRIDGIQAAMLTLGRTPHQGTLRLELGEAVRSVTKARAVFYFEVDDDQLRVRILAVFFGGQDHTRHMLQRSLAAR